MQNNDCKLSNWSACSQDCNYPMSTRTRNIINFSDQVGQQCPDLSETESCYNKKCLKVETITLNENLNTYLTFLGPGEYSLINFNYNNWNIPSICLQQNQETRCNIRFHIPVYLNCQFAIVFEDDKKIYIRSDTNDDNRIIFKQTESNFGDLLNSKVYKLLDLMQAFSYYGPIRDIIYTCD